MIRTVIWVVYFFAYLFFAQPMLWKVRKLRKEGKIEEHDRIVRTMVNNWALRLMKLAGATMEVTGKENIPEGPVVFAANHQGYADIPLLLTQLEKPNPLIAKKELEKVPLLRDWMTELN